MIFYLSRSQQGWRRTHHFLFSLRATPPSSYIETKMKGKKSWHDYFTASFWQHIAFLWPERIVPLGLIVTKGELVAWLCLLFIKHVSTSLTALTALTSLALLASVVSFDFAEDRRQGYQPLRLRGQLTWKQTRNAQTDCRLIIVSTTRKSIGTNGTRTRESSTGWETSQDSRTSF